MGLYSAFSGNAYSYLDSLGVYSVIIRGYPIWPGKEHRFETDEYKNLYGKEKIENDIKYIAYHYTSQNKELYMDVLGSLIKAAIRARDLGEPLDIYFNAHSHNFLSRINDRRVIVAALSHFNKLKQTFPEILNVEIRSLVWASCNSYFDEQREEYFTHAGIKYLLLMKNSVVIADDALEPIYAEIVFPDDPPFRLFSENLNSEEPYISPERIKKTVRVHGFIREYIGISYFNFVKYLNELE